MTQREFKALGHKVEGWLSSGELETFDVQPEVTTVEFVTQELTAFCPVTHQPDTYEATIEFEPDGKTVESKTLKLYLNSFRDVGIFGEDLAALICRDIAEVLQPKALAVTLVQQVRGGLIMTASANMEKEEVAT